MCCTAITREASGPSAASCAIDRPRRSRPGCARLSGTGISTARILAERHITAGHRLAQAPVQIDPRAWRPHRCEGVRMSHRKLLAGVAVIAALGAGATIGGLFGVPTLSGAQTPTPTSTATPVPGESRVGHHFGLKGSASLDVAAKDLNMTAADLKTALRGGQSIARVAKSKNGDPQKIINDLVTDATSRIDAAVSSGKITAAQATTMKANLTTAMTAFVNGTGDEFGPGFRGPFHGPGGPGKGGHRPTATATPASI